MTWLAVMVGARTVSYTHLKLELRIRQHGALLGLKNRNVLEEHPSLLSL